MGEWEKMFLESEAHKELSSDTPYEETFQSIKDLNYERKDPSLEELRGAQGEYEDLQKLRSGQSEHDEMLKKKAAAKKDPSLWERGKQSWNKAWQDQDTREGLMDVGAKWLQDQHNKKERTQAAIGDLYVDTLRGRQTRTGDVQAEVPGVNLYTELMAIGRNKKAKAAEAAKQEKWDKLLNANIAKREAEAAAAGKKE
jgi:hypothetical protein